MALPAAVHFEGLPGIAWTYKRDGFRNPRKGEFYLSGAIVAAYRAPNDLTTPYHVVIPVARVKMVRT